MRTQDITGAAVALDGLLRATYQQGRQEIGWDELVTLCEDAVVAEGVDDWDLEPQAACARVVDRGTRLLVPLTLAYTHGADRGTAPARMPQRTYGVLGLICTLRVLLDPDAGSRRGRSAGRLAS